MTIRFPDIAAPMGLGVGLDLPWGAPIGFERDEATGERVTRRVIRYLERYADTFNYGFISWQPRSRSRPALSEYQPAFDEFFKHVPSWKARGLHHTALNLGALEPYDRGPLIEFTNTLIERYGFAWVNEDLGLWSLHGRPLPYPLPPYLTKAGLAAAIANTREVQTALSAPLVLEFPGFSDGVSFVIGTDHAYDFFRHLAEATQSPVTLDTGHLLSYQWLTGKRGDALFEELERLPLAHCFEIHLSGCAIKDDRFMDYHHGLLMDEQLTILQRLIPRCPNLRAVTYEDPKFDREGTPTKRSLPNFERLVAVTDAWMAGASPSAATGQPPELVPSADGEAALDDVLERLLTSSRDRAAFLAEGPSALVVDAADQRAINVIDRSQLTQAARKLVADLLKRQYRGAGGLTEAFPDTFAADDDPTALVQRFVGSAAYRGYREIPWAGLGRCLEQAFYDFAEAEDLGDPTIRQREAYLAVIKAIATSPNPGFAIPSFVQTLAQGFVTFTDRGATPTMAGVVRGRLISGAVTPLIVDLVQAIHPRDTVATRHGVGEGVVEATLTRLRALGIVHQ